MNKLIHSEIRKLATTTLVQDHHGDQHSDGPVVHLLAVFAAKTAPGVSDDA